MNQNDHDQVMRSPSGEGTEAAAYAPLIPVQAPSKKRYILPLVISFAVVASLAILVTAILSAVLFLPLLRGDTLTPALEKTFPDGWALGALLEELEADGSEGELELCLPKSLLATEDDLTVSLSGTLVPGSTGGTDAAVRIHASQGKYSHDMELIKSGDLLAICGLLDAGYLSVDISRADEDLRGSILHPGTGSYSLSREEYILLLDLLETLHEADSSTLTPEDRAVLEDAFESICSACRDVLRPEVQLSWREDAFGLRKCETLTLDGEDLALLLDETAKELKENAALRDLLRRIAVTDENGQESNALLQLESTVRQLLQNKKQLGTLTFYAVSEGGYATLVRISYENAQKNTSALEIAIGKGSVLIALTTEGNVKNGNQWIPVTSTTSLSLYRHESSGTVRYDGQLTVSAEVEVNGESVSEEAFRLEAELTYVKESSSYVLTLKDNDFSLLVKGTWQMDQPGGSLALTVTDLCWQDVSIYDAEPLLYLATAERSDAPLLRLTLQVSDEATVSAPQARRLAELHEEEAREYLKTLPLEELGAWFEQYRRSELIRSLSFTYNLQYSYPLTDADRAYIYDRYYQPYCTYVRNALLADGQYSRRVLLYDAEKQFCVEISYDHESAEPMVAVRVVPVDQADFRSYAHVGLDAEGVMTPHHIPQVDYLAPTCTADGHDTYRCTQCAYSFSEELPSLGHDWQNPDELHGYLTNGYGERVGYYTRSCRRCGFLTSVSYGNHDIQLVRQQDGTYQISTYICYENGTHPYVYLPELPLEGVQITGFTKHAIMMMVKDKATVLEVPSYFTVVENNKMYSELQRLQALILPGTLQEIKSNAFRPDLLPRYIYFRGTAEEWAAVELNEYRTYWQHVPVIFIPDGVKRSDVEAQLYTQATVTTTIQRERAWTAERQSAMELLYQDGLQVFLGEAIRNIAADPQSGLLAIYAAWEEGGIVKVFDTKTGMEVGRFSVKDNVHCMAVDAGHVVFNAHGYPIHAYSLATGEITQVTDGAGKGHPLELYVDGDLIYARYDRALYCYGLDGSVRSNTSAVTHTVFQPENHRLLVFRVEGTFGLLDIYDSTSCTLLETVTLEGNFFDQQGMEDLGDVLWVGQMVTLLPNAQPGVSAGLRAPLDASYFVLDMLYSCADYTVLLALDGEGKIQTVVQWADGSQSTLRFYASGVIPMGEDKVLLTSSLTVYGTVMVIKQ